MTSYCAQTWMWQAWGRAGWLGLCGAPQRCVGAKAKRYTLHQRADLAAIDGEVVSHLVGRAAVEAVNCQAGWVHNAQ